MSIDDVTAFFDALERDPPLARRFSLSASPDSAAAFAAKEGFEFSPAELLAWLNERYRGELTDDQLEQVAGGSGGSSWSALLHDTLLGILGNPR
jgi:predicted ribosomally synthesized peptide with nif11-like leader